MKQQIINLWASLESILVGRYRRLFLVVAAGLPCLLLASLLVVWAVNVPFWDQWELVTLFQKHAAGTLGFADFFAQHNEHRILFPRLIMYGLAMASSWNILLEVATNVVLAIASFWFLYLILRKTFASKFLLLVSVAFVSLIFFSPLQWENWIWGWQIQWFLNILGLIVAVWALTTWNTKSNVWRLVVAATAAAVATYSLASGFFVWLVCLPILIIRKDLRKLIVWWIVVAVAVITSHYVGYVDPAGHPSKTIFLNQPLDYIKYVLTYLSRPFSPDFLLSIKLAVLYLTLTAALFGYLYKVKRAWLTGSLLPWICLGLYGLAAAASTGVSRLGFGVEQAYSNRYVTLSNLLLVAVVVAALRLQELQASRAAKVRWFAVVVLVGIMLLVMANFGRGAIRMYHQHLHLKRIEYCLRTASSPNDRCLLLAYPNQQVVWERLQYLRQTHRAGL